MRATPSLPSVTNDISELFERAIAIRDGSLFSSDFVVADWTVQLNSTRREVAELYASRLRSGNAANGGELRPLVLNILETDAIGWPRIDDTDWGPPGHFEQALKTLGLRGVYLTASEFNGPADFCTILDPRRSIAAHIMRNIDDLPPWDAGVPCRIALNLAAVSRGWCLIHAGTLALGNEGALLVGSGGTGKSATTLAGIAAGLQSAGDDYVLVSPEDPPVAYRVYNLVKLDRARLLRFGTVPAHIANRPLNWQNKIEFDPAEIFPGSLVEAVKLRAILVPNVAHAARTTFSPTSPHGAFRRLAPSLWGQLPGARAAGFRFASWLTRTLPSFTVELSDEPAEIGDSVRGFLEKMTP